MFTHVQPTSIVYLLLSLLSGSAIVNLISTVFANFANSVDDRRSITGYAFLLLAGVPLASNTTAQYTTALSTIESENYAVCKTTQKALHLRILCEEAGIPVDKPHVV
jgi:hypothetical protein